MTIVPLVPDTPLPVAPPAAADAEKAPSADAFGALLGAASASFERAAGAETAFVRGTGGLQEMVVERAQAGVVLAIASAAAARTAQALTTILNMQV